MSTSPRWVYRHRLRQAQANLVERIIAKSYAGQLPSSEGEGRKIQSLDDLTRLTLEAAISDLTADVRVTLDVSNGLLVVRLVEGGAKAVGTPGGGS